MYLVTSPSVQKKIQEELGRWWLPSVCSRQEVRPRSEWPLHLSGPFCSADTVIGSARQPRLSDRPQLPYLEAFILETFRHSSFVPFTIPHR